MSSQLQNILNDLNGAISEQQLLSYIKGNLNEAEREKVEQILSDNPFASDAVQGLAEVQQKEKLPQIVSSLKKDLRNNLNKPVRKNRKNDSQMWNLTAVVIILLLLLAAWLVLRHLV